jgi:D-arabinose 1-dehydrogenase
MENVATAKKIVKQSSGRERDLGHSAVLDAVQVKKDRPLFEMAQAILGEWLDYSFTSPEKGWSIELKRKVDQASSDL